MTGITSAISGGLKRITIGWIGNTILAILVLYYGFMYSFNKLGIGKEEVIDGKPDLPPLPEDTDIVDVAQERLRRLRRLRRIRKSRGTTTTVEMGTAAWYGWLVATILSFILGIILLFSSTFLLSEPYISWMKGIMGVSTKNLGFGGHGQGHGFNDDY